MKQIKRLTALLITIVLLAASPLTAMAAGGYVPTRGIYYYKDRKEWKSSARYTWSYNKNGKITRYTATSARGDVSWRKYTWKKNHISKVSWSNGDYSKFSFKNGMLKSCEKVADGKKDFFQYSFKKDKAILVTDEYTATTTYTKKNQIKKNITKYNNGTVYTTDYTYYPNGNRKSYIRKSNKGYSLVRKYNRNGLITSSKTHSNETSYSYTYTYKFRSGRIKERICTYKSGGRKRKTKIGYTKWKKVNRIRNCDDYGYNLSLGG